MPEYEEKFFSELLDLCVKYKVAFTSDDLSFDNGISKFAFLEVHGRWPVSKGALIAERVKKEAEVEIFKIDSNVKR